MKLVLFTPRSRGFNPNHIMKKTLALFAMAIVVLVSGQAQGAVIANWNFTSLAASPSTTLNADSSSSVTTTPTLVSTLGTGTTEVRLNPGNGGSGYALQYANTTTTSGANSTTFVITLKASTALTGVNVSFASATAAASTMASKWGYSVSGGSTGTSAVETPNSASFVSYNNIFSAFNMAANSTLTITVTFSGASPTLGRNISFDDISVTAVPEPANYAMALFGLVFVGGTAGRFYLARRQQA